MLKRKAARLLTAAVACSMTACGSATPAPQEPVQDTSQVVVFASPPAQNPGPVIAADPVPIEAPPDLSAWVGVWEDDATAGHVRATIRLEGMRPTVVDVTEAIGDMEHFELRSTQWEGGVLSWSEYVPSTDYLVRVRCTDVEGDVMNCTWSNDHKASGQGPLKRVGDR